MKKWLPLLCLVGLAPALVFATAPQAPAKAKTAAAKPAVAKPAVAKPVVRAAVKPAARVAAKPAPRPKAAATPLYSIDSPEHKAPAANTALGRILQNQTIRFCVRTDVPPFGYFSNKGLTGFDIHLATELARQLSIFYKKNLHVSWITINARERITSLQQNQCDVVAAAFSYTAARAKQIAFSDRYLKTDKVIVANANISRTKPITALVKGTTNSAKGLKGKVVRYNNYKEIIYAMESGAVDYIVTDRPIALHMIRSVTRTFKIVKALPYHEQYALGMRLTSKALQKAINLALRAMAVRGRLAYLHRQWL